MTPIDRIVFGDNQFFGINHMSQDKAQAQAERFANMDEIFLVYGHAFNAGIRAVMLFAGGSRSALGKIAQGAMATLSFDPIGLMKMLIDEEMSIFRGLDVRVVFLQNIVVDLILGFDVPEPFVEFSKYVRKKYGALPGFITQNMPYLTAKLREWGIGEVVICSSVNKLGYLMSPGRESYEQALAANDPSEFQMMAMATLASGALSAPEAYDYINALNLQSVTFGASSKSNIDQTVRLIEGAGSAP